MQLCEDGGDQFVSTGVGLALFVVLVGAVPLAALGIGLSFSRLLSRWRAPWIRRAIRGAVVAQGGCLAASVFFAVIRGGMLVEGRGVTATLLGIPVLLHPALNIAGIAGMAKDRGCPKRRYTVAMLTLNSNVVLIVAVIAIVGGVTVCLTHWLAERLLEYAETRVPFYRRELDARYASFHRFLRAVRLAAIRGVR